MDADCGDGGYCSPSWSPPCGSSVQFECHTPNDECVDDTDCGPPGTSAACTYSQSLAHWVCASVECIDGGH
jgi:hypothetical protein